MSIQHGNAISNHLSLRPPQRDSLEILAHVCEIVSLEEDGDMAQALETIKSEFTTVEDFERDFPSLCFAIATVVGKPRLMEAFISYLYLSEGIRQFTLSEIIDQSKIEAGLTDGVLRLTLPKV